MKRYFLHLFIGLIIIGCSGISIITGQYSDEFLKKVEEVKIIYKQGENELALRKLNAISDQNLNKAERAMKYNLIGVIYFSDFNYQTAIKNFNEALVTADADTALKAQIKLNLASAYFKMANYRESFAYIRDVNYRVLKQKERMKHHNLSYILSQQLNNVPVATKSLILLTLEAKNFQDFRNSPYSESLVDYYFKLDDSARLRILQEFERDRPINVAFLGKMEAEKLYYSGRKGRAKDVVGWLSTYYSSIEEVKEFVEDFRFRMENYSKIDPNAVGVILPMSGKKASYGKKALKGIDAALNDLSKTIKTETGVKIVKPKIYTKDSYNSNLVGSMAVRELVEKHYVSVIIGGLFSDTAKEEYLEARKFGVVYVSLSPIYLPKDEKNHLLIEIPGSVESQVATAFSDVMLKRFGSRVALLYPESEGGQAYVNEVWRKAKAKKIELTSIHSYEKNITDYRDSVEKLLGLKFKREREEEYTLWKDIYTLQGKRTVRRVQTLSPVLDFDWIYLPAYPHEALQIVPAFNYYDALNVSFVGGPSWRSRSLIREQKELGKLQFVGDDPEFIDPNFRARYYRRYGKSPKLIETLAYDGFNVGFKILTDLKFKDREQLEMNLKNRKSIKGLTGLWYIKDGIWLKDLVPLTIERQKIVKIFKTASDEEPKEDSTPAKL
jgi:ABC-type branched-subunit amino acid transport system substrate-binding protein